MLYVGLDGLNEEVLMYSVISAAVHTFIELFIFILESSAVKTSLLKYAILCLNGRLNWVPFIDSLEKC